MATRGRKPGVKIGSTGPQVGSMPWRLSRLAVGERMWHESTAEKAASTQRQVTMWASRTEAQHKYMTRCFTAVSNSKIGVTYVLVMIERIE